MSNRRPNSTDAHLESIDKHFKKAENERIVYASYYNDEVPSNQKRFQQEIDRSVPKNKDARTRLENKDRRGKSQIPSKKSQKDQGQKAIMVLTKKLTFLQKIKTEKQFQEVLADINKFIGIVQNKYANQAYIRKFGLGEDKKRQELKKGKNAKMQEVSHKSSSEKPRAFETNRNKNSKNSLKSPSISKARSPIRTIRDVKSFQPKDTSSKKKPKPRKP